MQSSGQALSMKDFCIPSSMMILPADGMEPSINRTVVLPQRLAPQGKVHFVVATATLTIRHCVTAAYLLSSSILSPVLSLIMVNKNGAPMMLVTTREAIP